METITVQGSRAQVRQILYSLPRVAAGSLLNPVRQLYVRIGLTALGRIKNAFSIKAKGGTDDTGLSWPKLSPYTIAYSRRHPKVPKKSVRARYAPSWNLYKKQRDRWWALYEKYLNTYHDKGRAAAAAWRILKAEGARTMMDDYGHADVEILRDTDLLFNSLTPGASPDQALSDPPQIPEQVFRLLPGEVIIGTSRKWAWTHHQGTRRIPQRRLWPDPKRWPSNWWQDILTQARQGLIDITLWLLGG